MKSDDGVEIPLNKEEAKKKREILKWVRRKKLFIIIFIMMIFLVIIIAAVAVSVKKKRHEKSPPIRASKFSKAAVATDRRECSEVGRAILQKKGSAVDAAVASLFCVGLLNMQSCGIGGGGFMNFYNRTEKKAYIYDFREVAPLSANETMYVNNTDASTVGGLSIAVPGNVKGLYHVWKKHGRLQWRELIEPTIKIAEEGFVISKATGKSIEGAKKRRMNAELMELLEKEKGSFYGTGDKMKNTKLAETLKKIQDNPDEFYNGALANEIVDDINEAGGIFQLADLKNYKVKERKPLETLVKGMKIYSMPPPGSGSVVEMTINILQGYNISKDDIKDDESILSVTHRIIEAFKFAFAWRPFLGDPDFVDVNKTIETMLNKTFAEELRMKIKSLTYPNESYYGGYYSQQPDYGTSHLSILSEEGDAVAATDTINYGFGSKVRSRKNGIIYNNEMDDFGTPGLINLYDYPPAKANFIKPGKRPLSSMSPTVVTDKSGDVIMIAGASGGSRIITATTLTLIRTLYLKENLGKAVKDPRVHTQLIPYQVYINNAYNISEALYVGLKKLGHKLFPSNSWSAVQAIYKDTKNNIIYAMSDPRKGGLPAGY